LRGLSLGTGVFLVGDREGNNANTFQIPGYARVDLLAAYEWKLGPSRLIAQLNVENLLDEEYFLSAESFRSFVFPGAPRTFLESIHLEF
jgi:iron complex outermembrane receptor protein